MYKQFLPFPTLHELSVMSAAMRRAYSHAPVLLRKAFLFSIALHAVVIFLKFVPEDSFKQWDKQALQVVLVNASSNTKVSDPNAQVLAQSTLKGGGEADEGLVKSPLPDMFDTRDGDALVVAQKQVQMLEKQQSELLAALKSNVYTNSQTGTNRQFNPKPGSTQNNSSELFMRQIAVLDKQVQDYNARPKRQQLSPSTKEAVFAQYYAKWSERLERLGTQNYPPAAKGKSGEVVVTVSIRPNGQLDGVEIMQSSGNKRLDRAAMRLLQQLAPYQRFTGELKNRVDILDITTKLIFTPAQTVEAEVFSIRK